MVFLGFFSFYGLFLLFGRYFKPFFLIKNFLGIILKANLRVLVAANARKAGARALFSFAGRRVILSMSRVLGPPVKVFFK